MNKISALYRGKKTAQTTATASAVTAPQPVVLQSSPQQPKVSKEVFNTNANKALDAIYNTPKIKNDLLNFTYNLKDDDRGKLFNVLNSGDNKLMYDNIKANIRSEIETNAIKDKAATTIQRTMRERLSQKDQTSRGGRRRTKKSKYYNKRKRTKRRRVKRRRTNKRRN